MQQRVEWLDFIKVFGVLTTIFLHSNSVLYNFQTAMVSYPIEFNLNYWNISVVFASLTGPSFALIFMYLGARVFSSKITTFSHYMHKAKQLFLPLLFWSFFALLFQMYIMHWSIDPITKLTKIITSPITNNLIILYLLIIVFLLTPLVKSFIKNKSMKQQFIIAIGWLLTMSMLLSLGYFFDFQIHILLIMSLSYLGFMQFGYLLTKIELTKRLLMLGLILFIIGNLWTIIGSIYSNQPEDIVRGIYVNYYFSRISIPVIINSLGLFILLRYFAEKMMQRQWFSSVTIHISSVALGMCMVYTYWFVILGTEKIGIELTAFSGNPLWSVPLTALLTIIGSMLTVVIIKRIPYLHHVTPKLY